MQSRADQGAHPKSLAFRVGFGPESCFGTVYTNYYERGGEKKQEKKLQINF